MQTKTHGENIKQPNQPGTKRSDEPFVCQKVQKFKYKKIQNDIIFFYKLQKNEF